MSTSVQRGVASVEVAGAILHVLRNAPAALSLQQLASLSGLSRPRLHHYLVSLIRIGLVRKVNGGGYALGAFALEMGLAAADNLDLQHASARWLRQLSAETGESSFFSVSSPQGSLIVRWEQGSKPLTVHARLGTVMPILTSATGLVWFCFDPENSAPVFEAELRRIDPALRQHMRKQRLTEADEVRRQSMAVTRGSMIANVNALACPVMSRSSKFAGVLTVLGLGGSFDAEPGGVTARQLRLCSTSFGERLP